MSTFAKIFNRSVRLLSSHSSPLSFSHSNFGLARHSFSRPSPNLNSIVTNGILFPHSNYDPHHYMINLATPGFQFDSGVAVLQFVVKTLAKVLGCDEEAKRKIYYVCADWYHFSFGAEIDKETSEKVSRLPEVVSVLKDFLVEARNNSDFVESINEFSPINWNQRLHSIFTYQQSSICKNEEICGHWLINIKEPADGPGEAAESCVELLAKVFGSEKEAQERIYAIWYLEPFGFGAEMDVEASKLLREQSDVLNVLPDCDADVKNKDLGVLCVFKPSIDSTTVHVDYVDLWGDLWPELSEAEVNEDE